MTKAFRPTFSSLLHRYYANVRALRELHDKLTPHVSRLSRPSHRFTVNLGLDDEGLRAFAAALEPVSVVEGVERERATPDVLTRVGDDLRAVFAENEAGLNAFVDVLDRSIAAPAHAEILRASLLAMVVAAFEALIAGVASQRYLLHPGALSATEPEFSLADLEGLATLDDARELLISKRIDILMRGGLDDWSRWFEKHADVDFAGASLDYVFVYEAFQRRNVVMHNGGLVSRLYKARLQARDQESPEPGSDLAVDAEYLEKAFTELTVLGLSVGVRAWLKWRPSDSLHVEQNLDDYVSAEGDEDRWESVRALANLGQAIASSEYRKNRFLLDELLARKLLDGIHTIADDLATWDTSALHDVFQLGAAALGDDLDSVFAILPVLIERKEVDEEMLREWSALDEARQDPRWEALPALPSASAAQDGDAAMPS
ncbi:MAG TPA: hypothetical protein VN635_08030 [Conexibacter sp.]|nr:hypothetical protein [Conexibacter sp.]